MDMYLLNDGESLKQAMAILKMFQARSVFKVNYDKTSLFRIGSARKSQAQNYVMTNDLRHFEENINVLGVEVMLNKDMNLLNVNYDPIMQKVQGVLSTWNRRNLSLNGKVLIINSMVASLFTYKMLVLPEIPTRIVNQFNTMISKFIWNGRVPKIVLSTLQLNREDGGLKLVNLALKDSSLKVNWIKWFTEDSFCRGITRIHRSPSRPRPAVRPTATFINIHEHPL